MPAATEAKDIKWLVEHLSTALGQDVDQVRVRQLLRKVGDKGDSRRWEFKGVKDPNVVAVTRALKEEAKAIADGTPRRGRPRKDAAAPAAAPAKKAAAPRKSRAKKVEPVEDELFEDDELDLD